MKKKPKSSPKKPKKAAAKKPAPKKVANKKPAKKPVAKKPAAKKPVKKKPAPKKPVAKKPDPKAKVVKKPVAQAKPDPKKVAKAQAKPALPTGKPEAKKVMVKAAKSAPKAAEAPAAPAKPKRPPAPKKKRFIVMPIGPNVPSEIKDDGSKQKGLYKLEYIVYSSPDVLFEFLSTAGGLEKWFAPRVFLKDNTFIFSWGNDEKKEARMLAMKEREFVRFRWADQPEKRYFEFRMQIDDLTSEVALIVSDFADTTVEQEEAKLLWDTQIQDLLHALGSA